MAALTREDLIPREFPSSVSAKSPSSCATFSTAASRRPSISSHLNRDYILGLADSEYQATAPHDKNIERVHRHPATFQCTLCAKRFTRAYNLQLHLRTHTEERPFVCAICGKAFVRQRALKFHEGYHSVKTTFVCNGDLNQGGQWGCGRHFSRTDMLAQHFCSEVGRVCIQQSLTGGLFL